MSRHKLFERWYQNSTSKKNIIKIDKVIEINIQDFEIQKLFTAFMFHKKNKNFKRLMEIYNNFEEILNREK